MPRSRYSVPQDVRGWSSEPARHLMHRHFALPPSSHLRDYVTSMLRLALTLAFGGAAIIVIRVLAY
jgi:hypothetical protein